MRAVVFFSFLVIHRLWASDATVIEEGVDSPPAVVKLGCSELIAQVKELQWQMLSRFDKADITQLFYDSRVYSPARLRFSWPLEVVLDAEMLTRAMRWARAVSKSPQKVTCLHSEEDLTILRAIAATSGDIPRLTSRTCGSCVHFLYSCFYVERYDLGHDPADLQIGLRFLVVGVLRNHKESMLALATILEYAPESTIPWLRKDAGTPWSIEAMMRRLRLAANRVVDEVAAS